MAYLNVVLVQDYAKPKIPDVQAGFRKKEEELDIKI